MRHAFYFLLLVVCGCTAQAQMLSGFKPSGSFGEQQLVMENNPPDTRILINAPTTGFGRNARVLLVFYALPNGNTIEQTFGKKLQKNDDWHFDIQHIGTQTRFLRHLLKHQTIVAVYVESKQKSWPAFVANTKDSIRVIKSIVDQVKNLFLPWNPQIVMNGHSGGGRFIFSYLNAVGKIPDEVVRIAFLDSDYGYEDSLHGAKIVSWLKSGKDKSLCTLAYNDSVVIYNGKHLVSPTGGTWYRSRLMLRYLKGSFSFRNSDRDSLVWHTALRKRVELILRNNPDKKIFHTVQVERNGFIHSMLSGTSLERRGYTYFGKRAYTRFIEDATRLPIRRFNIPGRNPEAETGSVFMRRITKLEQKEREREIFLAISAGNIPDFLRNTITMKADFQDATGLHHAVVYEVMPDYLAIGCDSDFCRIPMNPYTAQQLADLFGASLLTEKISDQIYLHADQKLTPFNYLPVGNANERVEKFVAHNAEIERQMKASGGQNGQLVAGIKKDVILSCRNASQPEKVVIYGWHETDGQPIQHVYSGHVYWYVDYSHGIRLMNDQVLVDGKPRLLSELLSDPALFMLFSDENEPMKRVGYHR